MNNDIMTNIFNYVIQRIFREILLLYIVIHSDIKLIESYKIIGMKSLQHRIIYMRWILNAQMI